MKFMYLKIKLHPRAKRQEVVENEKEKGKYEVFVKAKAERNLANKEMLKLLAERFEVEEKKLRIISGHHRPNKTIEILGEK